MVNHQPKEYILLNTYTFKHSLQDVYHCFSSNTILPEMMAKIFKINIIMEQGNSLTENNAVFSLICYSIYSTKAIVENVLTIKDYCTYTHRLLNCPKTTKVIFKFFYNTTEHETVFTSQKYFIIPLSEMHFTVETDTILNKRLCEAINDYLNQYKGFQPLIESILLKQSMLNASRYIIETLKKTEGKLKEIVKCSGRRWEVCIEKNTDENGPGQLVRFELIRIDDDVMMLYYEHRNDGDDYRDSSHGYTEVFKERGKMLMRMIKGDVDRINMKE